MDAHDIAQLGQRFDIAVFAGVLYHLRHPLFVLEQLGKMCDSILLETEFIPDDPRNCLVVRQGEPPTLQPMSRGFAKFIERAELNGDGSNWWVPDTECVMAMLRTAGYSRISLPVVLHQTRLLLVASKGERSLIDVEAFGR
jgi:tRNA (mo5U34)-methyltransferase